MRPFALSECSRQLQSTYPPSANVTEFIRSAPPPEVRHFLELWVAEGIPYAFRHRPMLWQTARAYLAEQIDIDARELTIIGSARIGYSMSPTADFGRVFHPRSDLDFTAVSSQLFGRIAADAESWSADYRTGVVQPSEAEKGYWIENAQRLPDNLARGFVDTHYVPNRSRYIWPSRVAQGLWRVMKKLTETEGPQWQRRNSLRVYRDWETFIRQLVTNTMRLGKRGIAR